MSLADNFELKATCGSPQDGTLVALFEQTAAAYPLRIALSMRHSQWSYQELNVSANRLAHGLLDRAGPNSERIAIVMHPDLPQIAAFLAVLKAGKTAVAVNAAHPPARLQEILEHADPSLVLVDPACQELAKSIAGPGSRLVCYDDLLAHGDTRNPLIAVDPLQTAVLVYTSGTTGRPKAVMKTHRQLCRNTIVHTEAMEYTSRDRLPLFASLSSGQGTTMVCCALLNGAALYPFPVAINGVTGLADWMIEQSITVYSSSASIFRTFMKTLDDGVQFPTVRAVRLASEPATSDDFKLFQRHFAAHCIFVHTLSSSETSNVAYSRRTRDELVPEGRLPIGFPSQEIAILDQNGQPVGPGETGELVVKSRFLASGYWRDEDLTATKFSDDLDDQGTRLFWTGDRGRINRDGMLEFVGRIDNRVKIRGNRIELSEIEDALRRVAGTSHVVVEAVERAESEPLLVAFIAADHEASMSPANLRLGLRNILPDHMVPSRIILIPRFPITPSGKIDRRALRELHSARPELQGADKPKTEYESLLCGIWAEVFELPEIGRNDNFFDLGGDSLIAAVMSARIHAALGIEVAPCRYFEHPELAGLAQVLSDLSQFKAPATPARELPVVRTGPIPLSYSQEAWWYRSQAPNLGGGHTTARCSRIAGPLDRGVLTECIKIIVRRHEMLRTTISLQEGQPAQVIHDPEDVQVAFYDVSADPNPEIKAKDIWKAEQAYIFDLTQPSLVRFSLIRLNDGEHWFLRSAHAMMGDGLSWTIFVRELAELYEARKQGRDSPLLQTLPAQYGDYAIAERKAVHPDLPRYRELLLWWAGFLLETAQPEHPAYRRALLRCMNAASSKPAFLRTILGALLRTGFRVPAPPRAELPFKRAKRKDIVDPSEGIIHWGLKPAVSLRLHELARQQGATRYAVRAAAFVAMLAAETRKTNVVLFGALSNRNRAASRDVFGYCNMPAMFVFDCQQQWTFRELLSHIRVRISAMQAHADFPYDRLHQEMRIWKVKMPTARVMLSTAWSHPCIRSDGIEITCLPDRFNNPTPALFDLKFDPINEETNCSVFFDARVYDPMKVRAFVDGFVRLLEFVSSRPDATIRTAIAAIQGAEGQPTASK